MRKVIGALFITLDGVVESPDQWQEHFDEDMGQAMMEQLAAYRHTSSASACLL